jgi:hypothetical protein
LLLGGLFADRVNKMTLRPSPALLCTALLLVTIGACGREASEGSPLDAGTDTGADTGTPDASDDATDLGADGVDVPVTQSNHGALCVDGGECDGGTCMTGDGFPEGYCTLEGCIDDFACGGDSYCVSDEVNALCAPSCTFDTDCRAGYECAALPGRDGLACLPADFFEFPADAVDGEACLADGDCRSGGCLGDGWPNGYCTTVDCQSREDCASDGENNQCLLQERFGGQNFCVRICSTSDECRQGYICRALGGGQGYCAPDPSEPIGVDPSDYPFEITCGEVDGDGTYRFEYDIPAGTTSYMVVPFAPNGGTLLPLQVDLPSGAVVDFGEENSFQLAGAQLFGYVNPVVFPPSEEFGDQLEVGAHTFHLETDSSRVCHYVLTEAAPGTTIDMNVYLVGIPGTNARTAPSDPDLQELLAAFDEIYGQIGIRLGEVRYYDIDGDAEDAYQILRNDAQVEELVALSDLPGASYDEVLSVNVFFVRAMAFEGGAGGAIGISSGLPGPAALHGMGASGVVFTSEYLGETFRDGGGTVDGNDYTAQIFAHEVGHYLGLFHTSEQQGSGFDPITDTPECSGEQWPRCADINNLMFPFAGIAHTEISAGQASVLRVNPLTKD